MFRCSYFVIVIALAILYFGAVTSLENKRREKREEIEPRVVGGEDALIAKHKYQVALYINGAVCGGSLLKPKFVLTAAHCVDRHTAGEFLVRAGSNNFWTGGIENTVVKIIPHPKFISGTVTYDYALLKLKNSYAPYMATHPIQGIPLATELPLVGETVILTGFGLTANNGQMANVLQKAELKIIDKIQCGASYGKTMPAYQFCAGIWEGGKGSCQGDSGGPLVKNGTLVGVVSWGYICAEAKYPGVYATVPYVRKWIVDTMLENTP